MDSHAGRQEQHLLAAPRAGALRDRMLPDTVLRDTVLVPPGCNCVVILDANQSGIWAGHGHILDHAEAGTFTGLRHEGAHRRCWQPEQLAAAMEPLPPRLLTVAARTNSTTTTSGVSWAAPGGSGAECCGWP